MHVVQHAGRRARSRGTWCWTCAAPAAAAGAAPASPAWSSGWSAALARAWASRCTASRASCAGATCGRRRSSCGASARDDRVCCGRQAAPLCAQAALAQPVADSAAAAGLRCGYVSANGVCSARRKRWTDEIITSQPHSGCRGEAESYDCVAPNAASALMTG